MSPNTTPSAARAVSARRPFDCVCAAVAWFDILLFPSRLVRLALRPAHSRRHLYVTCYTEGFSHFVTSMTAPVASGWSVRRMGLAPTGKRRLLTAHANSGHSARLCVLTGSNPKHAFLVGHGTGGIRQECAIPLVP